MSTLADRFNIDWNVHPASTAMVVHLSDGTKIPRSSNQSKWETERIKHFGLNSEDFWLWQEGTADAMWNLAIRQPNWPPQTFSESIQLMRTGQSWLKDQIRTIGLHKLSPLAIDSFRTVSAHLSSSSPKLRQFVDAQLLISAQTTSAYANALYGASAIDLPRRGVAHPRGGMGGMAKKLVEAIQRYGGKVKFRNEVVKVVRRSDSSFIVRTKHKYEYPADIVIFNLPPWNIRTILEADLPPQIRRLPDEIQNGWGAFMVYIGINEHIIPHEYDLHHQRIIKEPLGEGNSIFMSISPGWDTSRAPVGKRAISISTHTELAPWWKLLNRDRIAYEDRKAEYISRILEVAEGILPGLHRNADLIMGGTPVTFQRFTKRTWGWVGGFPQTSITRSWGPRLAKNLWIVGDTIFPGQSVPAVSLGGLRVANSILIESKAKNIYSLSHKHQLAHPGATLD